MRLPNCKFPGQQIIGSNTKAMVDSPPKSNRSCNTKTQFSWFALCDKRLTSSVTHKRVKDNSAPSPPPHLRYSNKGWPNTSFKSTQKETSGHELSKSMRPCHSRQGNSPCKNHGTRKFSDRQLDQGPCQGQLHDELRQVNNAT